MEALPCPFCGGKPKIVFCEFPFEDTGFYSLSHICKGKGNDGDRIFMRCGIRFETEKDAITHWNKRKREA